MKSETFKMYSSIINRLAIQIPSGGYHRLQGFKQAVLIICEQAKGDGINMEGLYYDNLGAFEQLKIEFSDIENL